MAIRVSSTARSPQLRGRRAAPTGHHGKIVNTTKGGEPLSGQPVTLRHDLITLGCGWMQADTQVGLGQERGGLGGRKTVLTINVGVLLAVIVVLRLRRRTEARSRNDEKLTVILVLALGVLVAPTPLGEGIANFLGQLVNGVTQASR